MSLRPSSRFAEVYRTGRRTRIGGIVVIEAPSSSPIPEVGVVAARKVGSAVARNRAKRRLRAAISMVPLRPSRAYVVVASPEVIDVSFESLVSWLRDAVATKVTPGRGTT
ncbi:ribonuclease P protein component [Actinomycetota bacterium]